MNILKYVKISSNYQSTIDDKNYEIRTPSPLIQC